jgi:hypothetical protein
MSTLGLLLSGQLLPRKRPQEVGQTRPAAVFPLLESRTARRSIDCSHPADV